MPLRLKQPVEKTFSLERTDKEFGVEGSSVTIKQASQREHEKRTDIFAKIQSKIIRDEVEVTSRFNALELFKTEARLTLVDCNIEDEDGSPLFRFGKTKTGGSYLDMSETEFDRAWGKLPLITANEIHDYVLEVNPQWTSTGEAV